MPKMKFTKEEALEKLKGILTNGGKKTLRMSEKSIERQLETLMPLIAGEDTELDDFIEKVKASFEVMNSNVEKDNSDFVNQWKKDHPEKNPDGDGDKGTVTPDLKEILERMKVLEEKDAATEREKAVSQKRRDLKKKLREKGVEDEEWCDMVLSEIEISESLDTDTKAESLLKLYNKQKSRFIPGLSPLESRKEGDGSKGLFSDIKADRQDKNK